MIKLEHIILLATIINPGVKSAFTSVLSVGFFQIIICQFWQHIVYNKYIAPVLIMRGHAYIHPLVLATIYPGVWIGAE